MTWLTWRQFRSAAAVAFAVLAVGAVLLATSPAGGYLSHDHLLKFLGTFMVGVPALLGAFWGAPLIAGELESGTYRLAWTQSVTRTRWLGTKVAIVGGTGVAVSGLLSLGLTLWSSNAVNQDRFGSAMFGERGIAPMGYAAFGLAVGITAGLLIRRTLPAMATTLVAFLLARIAVQSWVRPHFATPVKLSAALSAQNGSPLQTKPGVWVVSNDFMDAAGRVINNIRCGPNAQTCMARYHQVLSYQPANRYWVFQAYETAAFVAAAVFLIGFCIWWVRSRLS